MPLATAELIPDALFPTVAAWESPAFTTVVTLRRGEATLAAQNVRLTTPAGASVAEGAASEQAEASIAIIGATGLDIAKGDRFNTDDGTLIQVTYVRPITTPHVVAFGMAIDR